MKITAMFIATVALATGCTTNPTTQIISGDTSLVVVGEAAPAGYPKTRIEKSNGFCVQVTESWKKDSVSQQTIWVKNTERVSVNCGS